MEEVLEELRAKLKWTQGELEAQREVERQRQLQVGVEEECQGIQSRTGQGTRNVLRSQSRHSGCFPELRVRARMVSSWMCQVILGSLGRKIQLFGQNCVAKRELQLPVFAPSEGI